MSDETTNNDQTQPAGSGGDDPLGIIGWKIGGKYEITSYLGGGGFGEVYNAHNVNLTEQRLVVKFFKRVQARDRFDREAKILCMLDHPNISNVVDYLPDEGALVIQFIDGLDGSQILKNDGPLDERMFLRVARAVSDAIAYAHEKNIAHRDIKPHNIIVDKNEHVHLIDFGIAKEVGDAATRTGYQALTPMFAAPERQTGEQGYNPFLSDIYELGITLFNFLTNSMPYRNPVSPNLNEWGGPGSEDLSPQLKRILKKATHPDPTKRYQTAREMANDLKDVTQVYVKKSRKGLILGVAAVVIVAAGVVGGLMYMGGDSQVASPVDKEAAIPPGTIEKSGARPTEEKSIPAADLDKPVTPQESSEQEAQTERPESETPVQAQEPEPEPAPPPPSRMRISVQPGGLEGLLVDGERRPAGRAFDVAEGTHNVIVIHPEFPVYDTQLRSSGEMTAVTYDLTQEFRATDSIEMSVGLIPPEDGFLLELTLNGRTRRYTQFPVLDVACLAGPWFVQAALSPINSASDGAVTIDSLVVHPFGAGPRDAVSGSRGRIQLRANESGQHVPLLIYWSR